MRAGQSRPTIVNLRWFIRMMSVFAVAVTVVPSVSGQQTDDEPPAPPVNFSAVDAPWDDGEAAELKWELSPNDVELTGEQILAGDPRPVLFYEVFVSGEARGTYESIAKIEAEELAYETGEITYEAEKLVRGEEYFFAIAAVGPGQRESELIGPIGPVVPTRQFYDSDRFWMMIITILLCGSVIFWIARARGGHPVNVRKIAGLEAVDEAVGRATEMGRSVLFVPGIQDMNDIQTIAGITILARVSRTAAEYDAKVEVPTSRALVMTTAQETVQSSFLSAGRPDAYNEDLIYYVTDEQFGYVAYLQGMIVREKPAACFYMGSFFAESLILAETGNTVGAIQVAGTANPAQLPFFVAACDYTLIGEEFFAASAYLSDSPEEMGSLKGQDIGKVIVAVGLVVGIFFATLASMTGLFSIEVIVNYIRDTMMT